MAHNALRLEFSNAARLSKRHSKDLLGSIVSRVLYHGPGFLSSATWPLLPKKHYNGLINQSYIAESICTFLVLSTIDVQYHVREIASNPAIYNINIDNNVNEMFLKGLSINLNAISISNIKPSNTW